MPTVTIEPLAAIDDGLSAVFRAARAGRLHEALVTAAGVHLDRPAFALLTRLGDAGEVRVSDLAERLCLDVSTTSRKVAQLEAEGLVSRTTDPADRRAARLSLTPQGQKVLQRARRAWRNLLGELVGDWSAHDREQLGELLGRLAIVMERHGR